MLKLKLRLVEIICQIFNGYVTVKAKTHCLPCSSVDVTLGRVTDSGLDNDQLSSHINQIIPAPHEFHSPLSRG